MIQRVEDLKFNYLDPIAGWIVWAPHVFAMFLLGLYVGRLGVFEDPLAYRKLSHRATRWGVGVGLLGNLGFVLAAELSDSDVPSAMGLVTTVCFVFGATALCVGYASTLVLLTQRKGWGTRLAPLGAVGRMALSNYLLQSVIATTLFYSYGLGLYGKVGPAVGAVLAAVIFVIQVALSVWWARRFRFGPVEWLWRSLTYGKRQPMRIA